MTGYHAGNSRTASVTLSAYMRSRGIFAAALALLTVLVYVGSVGYEFVYDEIGQIQENPFLEEPDAARRLIRLETLTDGSVINGRRPVVLMTYLLDRLLWDLSPVGWRLSSLTMHVAVVASLFIFLEKLLRLIGANRETASRAAFVGALVFAWHPVNSESVHVAAFRPDILSTLFLVAALLCTCNASGTSRNHRLTIVCIPVFLLLGMGVQRIGGGYSGNDRGAVVSVS